MNVLGSRASKKVVVMRDAEVLVSWVAEKGGETEERPQVQDLGGRVC